MQLDSLVADTEIMCYDMKCDNVYAANQTCVIDSVFSYQIARLYVKLG